MEKLLKLLNEYNEGGHWRDENFDKNKLLVISKGYGFIKRLVENDKIDLFKSGIDELPRMFGYDYESVECKSDRLVMILSIQDNPIDFLVSIISTNDEQEGNI